MIPTVAGEVYMDPKRIAHQLVAPLRRALAEIKTERPRPHRRPMGIETAAARRHQVRSDASKRAWIKIHAQREAAKKAAARKAQ